MQRDWVQETSDWLVEETLCGTRTDRVVKGFCERLVAGGVPLVRGHVASGQLHPLFRSSAVSWNRDKGIIRDQFAFNGKVSEAWDKSPLKAVMQPDRTELRAQLWKGEGVEAFPVLKDFQQQGFTDYFCVSRGFSYPVEEALAALDGCVASFSTDVKQGFSDNCLKILRRLFPRLAVAIKTIVRENNASTLASTYLGSQAAERVLKGRIHRGNYDSITAAIWFSDMRDSTSAADQMDPQIFMNRLNRYFEGTAGAVLDHGGEVLRFIGDAVLAIFPVNGPGGYERAGRMALSAAKDSVRRIGLLNAYPPKDDPDPIEFGLGLHMGDVLFGNIGVPERLEFSVTGAAANEAARLQDLTKSLGCTIIVSDVFAAQVQVHANLEPMGSHRLRGVSEPQPVYALVT